MTRSNGDFQERHFFAHQITNEPNRLLMSLTNKGELTMSEQRITRLFGLALGVVFTFGLILNAFAF
jgi:hypothetical protein